MEELKNRLAEALEIRGVLPVDLARKTGINKGLISRYLKGEVLPKQSKIAEIAEALNVSPSWLLGYNVPMEPETIQLDKLTEANQARLKAYYDALIDSQGG
ncbi:MAG: helix-turn-helix transcriptional regulator [Selenomonadaceae bacterium]|nr:helix-turn-helix transcriptional regulator [Selenomonadaceae bacterium]